MIAKQQQQQQPTRARRSIPDPRALPIALKLAILLGIVLLGAGFITDRLVRETVRNAQQEVVLEDLETLSRSNAIRMNQVLNQEIISLIGFGSSTGVQNQLKLILENNPTALADFRADDGFLTIELIGFRQTHNQYDSVILLSPSGLILAADPQRLPPITRNPADNTWFTGAYNEGAGGQFISSPDDDFLTGITTGIQIALPVYDNAQPDRVLGVLYAVWNMSNISDITEVGAEREGLVLEPDGTVLIAHETDEAEEETANPNRLEQGQRIDSQVLTLMRQASTGRFVHLNPATNQEYLYGYVGMDEISADDDAVNNLRWTIVVRQPTAAVEASVNTLTNSIRITLGAIAGSITLVIALFALLLLLPLRRLTDSAQKLEKGDLTTPIPQFPNDEVGRLAGVMRALVNRLLERLTELRAAVQVSHAAALTLDIEQMLNDVAHTLTNQFDYPDVRIYLTDATSRRAFIQAASGGEGERLLRSGHRLAIDETSLIGRAILLGEPQIGAERDQLREAGLMTGRSELAIPLQSGPQSLGAVHILARRLGAFEPEDVDILRLIADQLSASIANARLFEQSQSSLTEIEALNRRLTRDAWDEYLQASGTLRHTPDPEQRWPNQIETVRQTDEIKAQVLTDAEGRSVLAAPLILRGQSVGSLAVTRSAGERWTSDEIALMESVASRMSMIAEGIRLVDESNRRALREQRVNEVSANILSRANSVESVLRSALNELNSALGSERIALRLGPAPYDGERHAASSNDGNGHSPNGDGD